MTELNRRDFMRLIGGTAVAGLTLGFPHIAFGAARKVVVVGGGVGGCTAAKYLRKMDPTIEVTLIEAKPKYQTCFMSNEILSGQRTLDSLTFSYDGLAKHGVSVLNDMVVGIDPVKKTVATAGGKSFLYDACVVSPGVDFKWEAIEGHDEQVSETITHAWFAGPQTLTLRKQLEAMPDGGRVLIVAPPNPFKCPPGPYERAAQVAMYCKRHKPKSKILILDAKDAFSKQSLFVEGWTKLYGYGTDNAMIEWVSAAKGGKVTSLDPTAMTLQADVEEFKGDVINIIPAQKAGKVAFAADLVDGDWCPINKKTFESKRHADIYVLGDAAGASPLPKSAYVANSAAKIAAAAIVDRFNGREPGVPSYVNTCYSVVGEKFGISVAGVYQLDEAKYEIIEISDSGGVSPANAPEQQREREVGYAHSWFKNVVHDMME